MLYFVFDVAVVNSFIVHSLAQGMVSSQRQLSFRFDLVNGLLSLAAGLRTMFRHQPIVKLQLQLVEYFPKLVYFIPGTCPRFGSGSLIAHFAIIVGGKSGLRLLHVLSVTSTSVLSVDVIVSLRIMVWRI